MVSEQFGLDKDLWVIGPLGVAWRSMNRVGGLVSLITHEQLLGNKLDHLDSQMVLSELLRQESG